MQIYKDGNGKVIIDGMGITTVKLPKDLNGKQSVHELIESRINLDEEILITGFHFKVEK
jgi:hypothetical protein